MVTRLHNQEGDTIVEVLIAAAIVGLILVVSFTIANSSLREIRMAQERSEAQRFAQAQVEQLDQLVVSTPAFVTAATPPIPSFCFDSSGAAIDSSSNDCKQGTESRYIISISRPSATSKNYFQVLVTWDGLSGSTEKLTLDYKVGSRPTNAP